MNQIRIQSRRYLADGASPPGQRSSSRRQAFAIAGCTGIAALLVGCSSGAGNGAANHTTGPAAEQAYGPIVTRAVGTAQPPVSASAGNATVIGVAGAAFDAITQVDTSPKSLDDTKIAFTRDWAGIKQIYVSNADGTNLKRLTSNTNDFDPAWSPDGTKIVFTSNRGGNIDLYVKNADGTGEKKLTSDGREATWSPDGTKIAFASDRAGSTQIFMMNAADGSGVKQLTNTPAPGGGTVIGLNDKPAWSPGGRLKEQIAYESIRNGNSQLWSINADGTGPEGIWMSSNTNNNRDPAWAPDGSRIAFSSDRAGEDGSAAGTFRIWTMTLNEQVTKQVTTPPATLGDDEKPSWSPDSRSLVFTGSRAAGTGLQVVTFGSDGTATQPTLIVPAPEGYPANWSGYLPRTPRKLVGTGGLMASAAAGFLFSQASTNGGRSKVASIVTFDAAVANRVNTRVDRLGDTGGSSSAVFTITAGDGTLNNLRYINYVDNKVIQAVGTSAVPSAAGILVSFDGFDGSVATVVPYNATKAAGASMKPVREGDALVFRGAFAGAWNAKGENVAPNGAHLVKIDAKTGRLIEAQ